MQLNWPRLSAGLSAALAVLAPREGAISRDGQKVAIRMSGFSRFGHGVFAAAIFSPFGLLVLMHDVNSPTLAIALVLLGVPAMFVVIAAIIKVALPYEWAFTDLGKEVEAIRQAKERAAADTARTEEARSEAKWRELRGRWYVRYPLAIGICVGVYLLYSFVCDGTYCSGTKGWVRQFALLWPLVIAAWYAREVVMVGVVFLGVLWLHAALKDFQMSTPSAVIIGAVIIAWAIVITSPRK